MEISVTQENLNKALSTIARVASGRSTLPILSNVLMQIEDNRLKISATNLDIAINKYIGAKIISQGSLTVPARLFQDFVANLPSGTISLKQEDNKLHVTTDNHNSTINGMSAEEFPVMPTIKDGESWTLPTTDLKKGLHQVAFAASSDEARPVLTGVYFSSDKKQLLIAATDSYRLAEKKLTALKNNVQLLLPVSAINDLQRILGDDPGTKEVVVSHDNQQARFVVGDTELIARLIDGKYPDYGQLIPTDFKTTATLNRNEVINIAKVSSLFARESAGSIVLSTRKEGSLEIRSVASQVGENKASAKATVSSDGEITLNARFLLDGLQAFDGEDITISFNEKLQPLLLSDPNDPSYIHIIMPLKS
jgi:DNA polymerase III subunit beta